MMTKEKEGLFQEQIDELVLLERRIERKVEQLGEYNDNCQRQITASLAKLDEAMKNVTTSVEVIKGAVFKVGAYLEEFKAYKKRVIKIFIWAIGIAGAIICAASLWAGYVDASLQATKTKLAKLNYKLERAPVLMTYNDEIYVRVRSNTERELWESRKSKKTYAKLWPD